MTDCSTGTYGTGALGRGSQSVQKSRMLQTEFPQSFDPLNIDSLCKACTREIHPVKNDNELSPHLTLLINNFKNPIKTKKPLIMVSSRPT